MCRDLACIESFVTDSEPNAIPAMEFYETTELRGQLDNWVGPNAACLMAFCRTAGFARVDFAGALGERGHAVGYRDWLPATGSASAPEILCIDNASTHDHHFSSWADDYATFYFRSAESGLSCDTVMARIGPYGARPIYVAQTGGGWQATCKVPPGLDAGWHEARLRTANSSFGAPVRIGIDMDITARRVRSGASSGVRLTRVADGKSFEDLRIRVGEDSAISVWGMGLPPDVGLSDIRVRLDGSELPAIWISSPDSDNRQINALLPAGLEAGFAMVSVAVRGGESEAVEVQLHS